MGGVYDSTNLSSYAYAHLNPSRLKDPDGRSTWIDPHGLVKDVINDGVLSIYQHLPTGQQVPPSKVGQTLFWDAFISPDSHKPVGRVFLGQDISNYVIGLAAEAATVTKANLTMDSSIMAKYVTLREASNILAGINARSHGETFDDYIKGAGAYNVAQRRGVLWHELTGKTYGRPPYFGEDEYTGSRVKYGYGLNTGLKYTPPPEPELGIPQP
jgi:filamentous hemagglutinin